ncbi:MAG: sulfatase [Proteobacteria bacterium]|nr:sulfatase [Pseudomonadota bacterium]
MNRIFLAPPRKSAGIVALIGIVGMLVATASACSKRPSLEGGEALAATASGAALAARPAPTRPAGPSHDVFSLADNRLLAHLIWQDGLAVLAGQPGIAKYLAFGRPWRTWTINARHEGHAVAVATRSTSWLVLPLSAEQASGAGAARTLSLQLFSPSDQGLRVKLNENVLPLTALKRGWQRLALALPAGVLRSGENRLEFVWAKPGPIAGEARAYAALEWLLLAKDAAPTTGAPELSRKGALWLPSGGGLAYYVFPYAGTRLRLRVASTGAADCELLVRYAGERGSSATGQQRFTLPGGTAPQSELEVALTPISEQVARLELRAGGSGCAGLTLADAALARAEAAPVVARGQPPRNVLFWMIDNARSDRFRLYNPRTRVETPVIDALGRDGTVFERSYIVGTESRVSHASLWTGVYPKQHDFIGAKARLSLAWKTLPELVRATGRRTVAWTANGNISEFWGFGEGWDFFRNTLHKGGGLTAVDLADHAIDYIRKQGDQPFLLYLGTIDPHVSWRGRQPWLDRYDPHPYQGKYTTNMMGPEWDRLAANPERVSARDRQRIAAIYDSTISYNDQQLGRVLQALTERGIAEQTMVVITADHGEELWELGRIGHGGSLRDTVVQVPLIVHYPPLFGRGVRVREGAEVAGALATIVDALDGKVPEAVQVASLLPLSQGVGRGYPRPGFASQYELAHVLRLENYKVWVGGKGEPRLFDLSQPSGERTDVAAGHPLATRWLTDALGTLLTYQDRWRQSRWGVASNHLAALPDDLEQGRAPAPVSSR